MFDYTNVAVEIWYSILLAVIDLPYILDTQLDLNRHYWDDAERYHNVDAYTESERHRRMLRLVCKSWRAFADEHKHRWITYNPDPGPNEKDHQIALKVIRLATSASDEEAEETDIKAYPRRIMFNIRSPHDLGNLQDLIDNCSSKARILFTESSRGYEDDVFDYIMDHSASLPNLRNLGVSFPKRSMPLQAISQSFPNLTTLGINDKPAMRVTCEDDKLVLPDLAMLKLDLTPFRIKSLETWSLPSLVHLITPVNSCLVDGMEIGFEPVRILGANLVFLYIYSLDVPIAVPRAFWSWFPNLLELSSFFSHLYFESPVPAHHPLKYIFHCPHYDSKPNVSIVGVSTEHAERPWVLHNLQLLPPNFRRLTIWNTWSYYSEILSSHCDLVQRNAILTRMEEICKSKGIRLEDQSKLSLSEYIQEGP
ncbi:hypothetical protein M408DRAFT_329761 [Serendipita vermifera MAFF 305830]|uniref:F-box domain-containing protein n=1 Tax=Serendipita vermifera MAFF 305830 TaxID=933852 RepID=A0A0C2WNJ5_SERVB|nr:hypothetical protein M408DRAFT_329761 [Serendipita vermifera MAFF 305830]